MSFTLVIRRKVFIWLMLGACAKLVRDWKIKGGKRMSRLKTRDLLLVPFMRCSRRETAEGGKEAYRERLHSRHGEAFRGRLPNRVLKAMQIRSIGDEYSVFARPAVLFVFVVPLLQTLRSTLQSVVYALRTFVVTLSALKTFPQQPVKA